MPAPLRHFLPRVFGLIMWSRSLYLVGELINHHFIYPNVHLSAASVSRESLVLLFSWLQALALHLCLQRFSLSGSSSPTAGVSPSWDRALGASRIWAWAELEWPALGNWASWEKGGPNLHLTSASSPCSCSARERRAQGTWLHIPLAPRDPWAQPWYLKSSGISCRSFSH